MINRESARTVSKRTSTSSWPTLRNTRGVASALEQMGFLKLAQGTNFTRAEQIGGGSEANAERERRNVNLSAVRRRIESNC